MEENKDISISMENKSKKTILAVIFLVGLFFLGGSLLKGSHPSIKIPENKIKNEGKFANIKIRPISPDEHIFGNPNSKIAIIEYSDTECPYCKIFQNTLEKITTTENAKIAWVFRHYPIAELHSKAFNEAEATECAWEQGGNEAFWKYLNGIFTKTESNNKLDPAELPKIAESSGLNVLNFNTCLKSGKYKNKIKNDIQDGLSLAHTMTPPQNGLGTPTSVILKDGIIVDIIQGAEPFESVMYKLEKFY